MNNSLRIVDTHAHLIELHKRSPEAFSSFVENYDPNRDFVLDVGITLADTEARRALHRSIGIKHWSMGLYPSHASGDWRTSVHELRDQLSHYCSQPVSGLCALGEIGIDGSKPYGKDQVPLLIEQIELANEFDLPIIVHSRAAAKDCLEVFTDFPVKRAGIMHCYSEAPELVDKFLDLGFYISFAGNITYKKSQVIVEAMKQVPTERILIETDSPYLSPEPNRSQINTPLGARSVLDFISESRGFSPQDLLYLIEGNIKQLFRLKGNA